MKKNILILMALTMLCACSVTGPKVAFNLPSLNGGQFNSEVDAKDKPIFVAFMATYCGYCKMSVPSVNDINTEFGPKGVKVVGIFGNDTAAEPQKYVKEQKVAFEALYNGADVADECKVNGVPHFVLLNKKHNIVKVWSGYNPQHNFAEEINKVL